MKKISIILSFLLLSAILFTGCSTNKKMIDGKYKATFKTADNHGWTDYVEITVKDSKITEVDYDSVDKDGNKKSTDTDYEEAMKGAGSSTYPSKYMSELEDDLIKKQNINDVDIIAGATTSSNDFRKLVKALEKNISKGDTTTVEVAR